MNNRNVLISGAGIAGLTLAFYLKKYGFDPTVVEIAPTLRQGGYMIDFWGVGFDVAERMGILPDLEKAHYHIPELVFVDKNGRRRGTFQADRLRKLINYRHYNLLRSGLANALYSKTKNDCEFLFGKSVRNLTQSDDGVDVDFSDDTVRRFDLVVGTDGLNSSMRNLVFGPIDQFEKFLGYYTASFTVDNYLGRNGVFNSYSVPGMQIGIYSVNDNKLSTFFIFKVPKKYHYESHDTATQKKLLTDAHRGIGWECPMLLEKMHDAPDFYFDAVSQIQLPQWSSGRVTLGGDACQCVSLIAGQGSSLAMAGMYVLAGELKNAQGNYQEAYARYEQIMHGEIRRKQVMAQRFAGSFVPNTTFGIWFRNTFCNLMFLPGLSRWFINQFLADSLKLPDY